VPSAVRVNNEAVYSARREADLVMTSTGQVRTGTLFERSLPALDIPLRQLVQFRAGRSPHGEAVVCTQGTFRSFVLIHDRARIGSVQVRRLNRDRSERRTSLGRVGRVWILLVAPHIP